MLSKAKSCHNSNIFTEFLSFDEVIPIGFSSENAITGLKNQNYRIEMTPREDLETEEQFEAKEGFSEFVHNVYKYNQPIKNI